MSERRVTSYSSSASSASSIGPWTWQSTSESHLRSHSGCGRWHGSLGHICPARDSSWASCSKSKMFVFYRCVVEYRPSRSMILESGLLFATATLVTVSIYLSGSLATVNAIDGIVQLAVRPLQSLFCSTEAPCRRSHPSLSCKILSSFISLSMT